MVQGSSASRVLAYISAAAAARSTTEYALGSSTMDDCAVPGGWWESVRSGILATLLLLPNMQLSFTTPFCEHVESSDASPGGHGRDWTRMDPGRVQTICRLAEGRGVYTNVILESGKFICTGKNPRHEKEQPCISFVFRM